MEVNQGGLALRSRPMRQDIFCIKPGSGGIVERRRIKSEGEKLGRPYAEELARLEGTYR